MRFKMFTYVPTSFLLRYGLPPAAECSAWFVPGLRSLPSFKVIGGADADDIARFNDLGELQTQYAVLVRNASNYDYVGFEHVTRPLFIDPMRTERLRADYPGILGLRERFVFENLLDNRRTSPLPAPNGLSEYWLMRSACAEAEQATVARWLGRVDVVLPYYHPSSRQKRLHQRFGGHWEMCASSAHANPLFRNISTFVQDGNTLPYQTLSFIMRSDRFCDVAGAIFELLDDCRCRMPGIEGDALTYFAARLFGIYIQQLILTNSLLRIATAPLLADMPTEPPLEVPANFDKAGYLLCNPDVAKAQIEAATHYLRYGWREDREWMP